MPDRPPAGLIAYNDLLAIGIMEGLRRSGWRVPRDVSVIGFDDILTSRLVTPPLTTIGTPRRLMGEVAVKNLLYMLHSPRHPLPCDAVTLPVRFVVRGSTAQRWRKRTSPALGTTMVSTSAS
jgi:LacI family transcriptional regulator